jgi:hypothetical protein
MLQGASQIQHYYFRRDVLDRYLKHPDGCEVAAVFAEEQPALGPLRSSRFAIRRLHGLQRLTLGLAQQIYQQPLEFRHLSSRFVSRAFFSAALNPLICPSSFTRGGKLASMRCRPARKRLTGSTCSPRLENSSASPAVDGDRAGGADVDQGRGEIPARELGANRELLLREILLESLVSDRQTVDRGAGLTRRLGADGLLQQLVELGSLWPHSSFWCLPGPPASGTRLGHRRSLRAPRRSLISSALRLK